MQNKRSGYFTRSSKKKQKTCERNLYLRATFQEEFGSLSDSGQGVWSELSKEAVSIFSESVVSIASFDGLKMHFACTGIALENNRSASILTSACLVRSFDDDNKIVQGLMIRVRFQNNKGAKGWLQHYDLHYNIAVIKTSPFPGLRATLLDHHLRFEPHSKVVAIGRCFKSGKLMATSGIVTDNQSGVYRKELMISTCEITMLGSGGPLMDFDGNFVGINFYAKERTPFLPRDKIIECLVHFETVWVGIKQGIDATIIERTSEIEKPSTAHKPSLEGSSSVVQGRSEGGSDNKNQAFSIVKPHKFGVLINGVYDCVPSVLTLWPVVPDITDEFRLYVNNDLRSCGYPLPKYDDGCMRLINTFEDEFGEDIWSNLSKKVVANMSRSVVSLASFSGEVRFFACSGISIVCNESTTRVLTSASLIRTAGDENKIVDNLKIEVCLPYGRHAIGTLQYYNLHYNIAIVSISGFRCLRTAELCDQMQMEPHKEVLAVGHSIKSGKLMATSGIVTDKPTELDCKELMLSTCKITKAGIGGPLVDLDGNFIGMNFYGMEETPFLPGRIILKLMRHSDAKGTVDARIMENGNGNSNRWPLPEPYWFYPTLDQLEKDRDINEIEGYVLE